jgi:hypothetical protein
MSQQITYEASVYSKVVKYANFKGKTTETELFFALDPIQLMQLIASFAPKASRSKNPAKQGQPEISDEEQIKFIRALAVKAAGFPSDDGESWEPFENFEDTIAGKAFLTQLVSSDDGRKDFTQKVLLDPFKAFVGFAEADPSNSVKDTQQLKTMLAQLENVFAGKPENESLEDRRARLEAEMAALEQTSDES